MTLYELQNKLGEQIDLITDHTKPPEERKKLAEMAMTSITKVKPQVKCFVRIGNKNRLSFMNKHTVKSRTVTL